MRDGVSEPIGGVFPPRYVHSLRLPRRMMHSSVLAGVGKVRAENPPRSHSTAWPATLILIGATSRRVYEAQLKRRDGVKVDMLKP